MKTLKYRFNGELVRAVEIGDEKFVVASDIGRILGTGSTFLKHSWRYISPDDMRSVYVEGGIRICKMTVVNNRGLRALLSRYSPQEISELLIWVETEIFTNEEISLEESRTEEYKHYVTKDAIERLEYIRDEVCGLLDILKEIMSE
ncbi:MAG: hypothetical protein II877_01590 [Synergistaceae bacterium]|nr:hypothetical protein [Synergistaceae bacterium]